MDQQQPDDRPNTPSVPNSGIPAPGAPYGQPGPYQQQPHQQQPYGQQPYGQQPYQQQPYQHGQGQPHPQPPPYGYYQPHPQPIYVTQQVQMMPAYGAAPKNMALALVLAFLFGPLGLFYASVTGGIVTLIIGLIISIPTFGFGWFLMIVPCMIWAAVATNSYNEALAVGAQRYTQSSR